MSLPRREGSRIGFVEKFSSYLEVSVVNMFKDQGRCPGLKKMKQTFFLHVALHTNNSNSANSLNFWKHKIQDSYEKLRY